MFENYIEKSRRGEQKGGKYLWREEIAEKVRSSKGKQTIQRYKYYYLEDFLRDSADTILNNIGKFFFKGKETTETKKIKNAYSKEDIQKNYGADEKTWMQHVFEYFRKKDKWDKRFSDKAVAEKFKKPIKQKVAEKINTLEFDDAKESIKIVKKELKKKENKTWKPNPSLMRKVWSMYTGKEQKKAEKEKEVVNEVLEKPVDTKISSEQWLMDNERIYLKQSETDPKTLQIWRKMTNSKNSVMLGNVSKVGDEVRIVTSSSFFDNWKETKENLTNIYNSTFEQKDNNKDGDGGDEPPKNNGIAKQLREKFNSITNEYIGTKFVNKKTGIKAEFSTTSQRELRSKLDNSKKNGFTIQEHFELANKIKELFEGASLEKKHKDDKNNDENVNIERFLSEPVVLSSGKKVQACITVKHIIDRDGHYMYSLETMDIKNALEKTRAKGGDHIGDSPNTYNNTTNIENVNGEHGNTVAMLGNDNAKKYGLSDTDLEILNRYFDNYLDFTSYNPKENNSDNDAELKQTIREVLKEPNSDIAILFERFEAKKLLEMIKTMYTDYVGDEKNELRENDGNNTRVQRDGLSDSVGQILTRDNENISNQDVSSTEFGDNGNEPLLSISELGERFRERGLESLGRLTKGQARKIREKCREILAKPDSEITESDKAILRNYEGAGGLNEGDQTSAAVLSEFYTPRDVIKKVWQLVDKYNPNKNKKVIEPSSGTGRFAEGREENFTLCELDETSARIAKLLHPQATVKQGAFQKLFMKNNAVLKDYKGEKYDVAVGNPPYGEYSGKYKGMGEGKIHSRYEEYFIDRTLDTLKDGGIMAFVVPSGFLRNKTSKAKELIAKKGKLLEAWRLPRGTFSSTDVGTDIIVLRKEPGNIEDFSDNKYFKDNSTHVIGTETFDGNWGAAVINLPEGKTVEQAIEMIDVDAVEIDKEIKQVAENIKVKEVKSTEKTKVINNYNYGDIVQTEKGEGKITGFQTKGKEVVGYIARVGEEKIIIPKETSLEEHENRSRAMKGNQNAKKDFHKEVKKDVKQGDMYEKSEGHIMSAAEFSKTFGKNVPEEDFKFWKNVNWEGKIEREKLTASEKEEIKKNKNFIQDSNGDYIPIVNYASGNIYDKLDELELNKNSLTEEQYEERKAILDATLPIQKKAEEIIIEPTANFAQYYVCEDGQKLVDKFLFNYCGFGRYGEKYRIKLSKHELDENLSWDDIWNYIHKKPVRTEIARSKDPIEKAEEQETNKMVAEQKKQQRRETTERLFNEFVRKLPESEKTKLEDAWNRHFNAYVNPDFTKIPLFCEGLSTHKGKKKFDPTQQQMKGISMLCNKGNGILAYDVGLGKTFCGIVATITQMQMGKAERPLIMCPKAVYKKWIKEIKQHFPNIQINELGNMSEKYMDKFKDEDGNINLPKNSLNICMDTATQKITFREETIQGELLDDMLDSQSIYDYDENGELVADTRSEREKANFKEKIESLLGNAAKVKKGGLFWEDLGIDHITVDELHNFKNVFSIPRNIGRSNRLTTEKKYDWRGRPIGDDEGTQSNEFQGLSGGKSDRALKLFAISQLIQRENNGQGFFGLSATPFNNSPIEIYNILSLVARNRLKDLEIYNLQDFLREFAQLKPDWKVDAKGDTKQSQTMKNFKNLHALQSLITEFIDKVDGEEGGVIRPKKICHRPQLDLTDLQKKILNVERLRMEGRFTKGSGGKPTGDTLIAMSNMRMATLSPALIDRKFLKNYQEIYPDFELPSAKEMVTSSPKLQFVCNTVAEQFKQRPTEGQVIYLPRGTENYDAVKEYLISQGLPSDSIAYMNSDTSLEKKEVIKDDFNNPDGKIKVIIGSETIKEGVSLNGNSTTLYNCFLGWNPTETIQVEGRIWRQGNKQGITHIVYPLMNDSIDSMMMQKYDEKSSRLNALWSYKGNSLNVEDYDPEEVKFALIKDPKKRAALKVARQSADLKKELRIQNALYDNISDSKTTYDRHEYYRKETFELIGKYEKDLVTEVAELEEVKEKVKKAKKSLTAAKKTKDEDVIKLAETTLLQAESQEKIYKRIVDESKSNIKDLERKAKSYTDEMQSLEKYWQSQDILSPDQVETKLSSISAKRQSIEQTLEEIKNKEKEYVEEETEKLRKESENERHETVDEVVAKVTKDISGNLRIMDDEFKAEIFAEMQEKFPHLKKSVLPLFLIKDGRFYIYKGGKEC